MSLPTISKIADAVTDELNAATLSQAFSVERLYQPLFELADMNTLHVTVVPRGVNILPLGRDRNAFDYMIDVAVQKKIQEDPADVDPLMLLVEEIVDLFRFKRLTSFSSVA